jgi:transposase
MYLRTTKRKNKDGSEVTYYQLAHNERHPLTKKPIAKIIHRFGRADKLDRSELTRLCQSIARVCGLEVHDPLATNESKSSTDQVGFPRELKLIQTVTLGTVITIEALWERLGLGKVLRDIASKKKRSTVVYERALLAMTANRLCEPESKFGVWDRWLTKVYLPSCQGLKLDHMYEAMDFLHEHIDQVEESIFFNTANLFNLDVDLIFYDTTTASFAIDYEDEDNEDDLHNEGLRKRGKSKEGVWTPQVVVALAVTRDGLPVRSWVFPGNTADVTTIEKIKSDLRGWNLGRTLFVADSGMNSKENRKELSRACGKYLLATRMASVSEIKKKVLSKRGRYQVIKDNLHAKEVIVGDGERRRRYILCYNPREAKRQLLHREMVVEQLEKKLASHSDKKATAQWAIELLASKRYKRYLKITTTDSIRIDRAAIREAQRYDGKWVLETNDDTITVADAAKGYKGLMIIERCFRSLKRTQIRMTPMFHWAPRRIETHVKICVLSLLIERVAELACSKPWPQIRRKLEKLQVSEFQTSNHIFFKLNEVEDQVQEQLDLLEIPVPPSVTGVSTLRSHS